MSNLVKGKFIPRGQANDYKEQFEALSKGYFLAGGDSFIKIGLYEGVITKFNKIDHLTYRVDVSSLDDIDKSMLAYCYVYEWVPEPEWYHNIPKEGVPCWVNPCSKYTSIAIITRYDKNTGMFFSDKASCSYTSAEPVTKETMPKLLEDLN